MPSLVSEVAAIPEPEIEKEPHESDNLVVEKAAIAPEEIVCEEKEDRIKIEPSPATQAVPSSVTDVASTTTEAITETRETVGVLEQVPIVLFLIFMISFKSMCTAGTCCGSSCLWSCRHSRA